MKWTQYSSRTGSSPRKKFGKAYHLELKNLGLQEALQGRTFEKELVVSQLLYRLIGIFSMRRKDKQHILHGLNEIIPRWACNRIDGAGAISSHSQDVSVPLALMATYKSGVFPSSYEILFPEQQEEACKMVEIALHAYAKQKDMPPAKLEIMKVKERSLFEERGKVYAHFNFLVINDSDGTRTLFFAEVDFLNCKEEKDVYLCCPLEENDNGK
ncbi:hypothetical protein OsI_20944 [Oryza sativa Indica Group]|uniref:DUF3615 domain-containing protein n=1 Tax=Oryza sativa subsp. indica TaxID=39946 RepID=B8AWI1_ORYSI|nr:hypothetical protein OsI_20944 [Oryza sativa Indica Group]